MNLNKLSFDEYRRRAVISHGNKYDYSRVIYTGSNDKIQISCNTCGHTFWQRAAGHLQGYGCPPCGIAARRIPKEKAKLLSRFLTKAKEKFGDKYDYSQVRYTDSQEKVIITCPVHGEYSQTPVAHLRSDHGCPLCGYKNGGDVQREDTETFVKKAIDRHGDAYDYSQVAYVSSLLPVKIRCKRHDLIFEQTAASHIRGSGCSLCGDEAAALKRVISQSEFEERLRALNPPYDFSQAVYRNNHTKVKLICPKHGEFYATPVGILSANTGCANCAGNVPHTTESFIVKAREIHGDLYDYSKVNYVNSGTKVTIICRQHGEFKQRAAGHLRGYGCTKCKASKGELLVSECLTGLNLTYVIEYKLPNYRYKYDFYLPDHNVFIEFHGQQHYEYNSFFHHCHDHFLARRMADETKKELVKTLGGKLIVISYKHLEAGTLEKYLLRQLIRYGVLPYGTKLPDLSQ